MLPGIAGIMAGLAVAAGAPALPGYFTAEVLGDVTNSTNTYADIVTLTIDAADFEAGATYACFWSVENFHSISNDHVGLRILAGATTIASPRLGDKEAAPLDINASAGMFIFQPGGSPATTAFKIQGRRETLASTATFRNARFSLLKLGPDDYHTSVAGPVSNAVADVQETVATLGFTPASAGDYVVFASWLHDADNFGLSVGFQLTDGVTSTSNNTLENIPSGASIVPMLVAIPITGASGAQSVDFRHRGQTAVGQSIVSKIAMVALRRDRFANSYVARLGATSAGTETSYTTAHSQTFTPAAADHLTIACWGHNSNDSVTVSTYSRYDDGGTILTECIREETRGSTGGWVGAGAHRITAYPASSRTQKIERKNENNTASAEVRAGAMIVTLDLTGL